MKVFKSLKSSKKKQIKRKKMYSKLDLCPQRKGICKLVYIRAPKKPNSAQRKVTRVFLTNKKELTAYIPGETHTLKENLSVLIHGGRVKDLPGVYYKVIRGVLDCSAVTNRIRSRSRYGTSKPKA